MRFRFIKQFYCAQHKAKLKHDADVCRHACSVKLVVVIKKMMLEYSTHQRNIPSLRFLKL